MRDLQNHALVRPKPAGTEKTGASRYHGFTLIGVLFLAAAVWVGIRSGRYVEHAFLIGSIGMIFILLLNLRSWALGKINTYWRKMHHYLSLSGLENEVLMAVSLGYITKKPNWSFVLEKRCGFALTNRRLLVFIAKHPGLSVEKIKGQLDLRFDIFHIPLQDLHKVSTEEVFIPPGIALFARRITCKPDGSREPISALVFSKFGKNAALFNKILKTTQAGS